MNLYSMSMMLGRQENKQNIFEINKFQQFNSKTSFYIKFVISYRRNNLRVDINFEFVSNARDKTVLGSPVECVVLFEDNDSGNVQDQGR